MLSDEELRKRYSMPVRKRTKKQQDAIDKAKKEFIISPKSIIDEYDLYLTEKRLKIINIKNKAFLRK